MTLPLYPQDVFGYETSMAVGAAMGFGFGFILERAGFGNARVLVAQFYGQDMRVFKVMFAAIVTAMLGMGILGGLGWMDLALLKVPETFLGPHLVGGLMLGVGFIVSGYCPGTAVVAVSSGNLDGLVSIAGIMAGSLLFGLAWPAVEVFYGSGARGVMQLHTLLGLPWVVTALGVTLMALGLFLGAEWVERWVARRAETDPPPADPRLRWRSFAGLILVGVGGLGTLTVADRVEAASPRTMASIGALDLATSLVEDPAFYHLVDLRPAADCARARVPGALCQPDDDTTGAWISALPPTRPLLVYGAGEPVALPSGAAGFEGPVVQLDGGFSAFQAAVLTAPVPPENPTPADVESYALKSALYGHFTGAGVVSAPLQAAPKAVTRAVKKGGGC